VVIQYVAEQRLPASITWIALPQCGQSIFLFPPRRHLTLHHANSQLARNLTESLKALPYRHGVGRFVLGRHRRFLLFPGVECIKRVTDDFIQGRVNRKTPQLEAGLGKTHCPEF
jgi:hypothetical protein